MNNGNMYTTDLDVVRQYPNRFTWGYVVQCHDIGPYTIVEHVKGFTDNERDSATEFHIYVDGKDTSRGALTLDSALLLAIVYKNFADQNDADRAGWAMRCIINASMQ